ncbi:MAG: hypothetical protein GY719_14295 [bacterium]|nr:hypothetical protein [bacterium]
MKHLCPVCGWDGLLEPAYDENGRGSHEICMSCGFEYGFDDHSEGVTHAQHRQRWIATGARWFNPDEKPEDWDLETQLANVMPGSSSGTG